MLRKTFEDKVQDRAFVKTGEALFVLSSRRRHRSFTHRQFVFQQSYDGKNRVLSRDVHAPQDKFQRPLSDLNKQDLKNFERGRLKISDIPYVAGYYRGFLELGYERRTPNTLVTKFHRPGGAISVFRFNLFSHPDTNDRQVAVWPEDFNDTWVHEDFYQETLCRWLNHDVRSRGLDVDLHEIIAELEAGGAAFGRLDKADGLGL